jgi:hypothetical protein
MIELPDLAQPKAVTRAAQLVRDREADVARAREAVEQAKASIQTAMVADRNAYADALDAGRADPGQQVEEAARAVLAEAERRLGVEEVRQQRARDALDQALSDALAAWTLAARKQVEASEVEALRLVDQLRAAVEERSRRRLALAWLERYAQAEKLPRLDNVPATATTAIRNPHAGPQTWAASELLDAIRAGIEQVTLEAEQARKVEHPAPQLHVA